MNNERYKLLMRDDDIKLTVEETAEGWHFCAEFDGLLVGPGMGELQSCLCLPKEHPIYKTMPADQVERATFELTEVIHCVWKFDDAHYKWDTTCDNGFQFTNGDVKENKFLFCPFCGGKIHIRQPEESLLG